MVLANPSHTAALTRSKQGLQWLATVTLNNSSLQHCFCMSTLPHLSVPQFYVCALALGP